MESIRKKLEQIQYQMNRFNQLYPTEEACLAKLVDKRIENLGACFDCGKCKYEKLKMGRILRCHICGRTLRTFVGTLFERMRRPRAWLLELWLMEHGVVISSSMLSLLAEVSQSTALVIQKKIAHAVKDTMEKQSIAPFSGFEPIICRRSTDTPRGAHPREEQSVLEKASDIEVVNNASRQNELDSLVGCEKEIYGLLSETSALHIDQICYKTGLEIADLALPLWNLQVSGLVKMVFGQQYVRAKFEPEMNDPGSSHRSKKSKELFLSVTKSTSHGISRKCLQYYLALFYWRFSARGKWRKCKLVNLCFNSKPITYAEILQYFSPLDLRLPTRVKAA